MRLGIFGGSFDPVHYGHLLLAEYCRTQCALDQVWFVPAATAPHKQQAQAASAPHRVKMLELAIGGHETLAVSSLEVDRGGLSFTAETLESLHDEVPDRSLFLLLGADSLFDLPNWRTPAGSVSSQPWWSWHVQTIRNRIMAASQILRHPIKSRSFATIRSICR